MCDGELMNQPRTFCFLGAGWGEPSFTDAARCSKVGVTVYRISGNRQVWFVKGVKVKTDSSPFGLGERSGWKLVIAPDGATFDLFLRPPEMDKAITVEYYLLLGANMTALQRHKAK